MSLLAFPCSVEQAIASLQELYPQTVDADGALVLRSQILITITEIIIVHGWIVSVEASNIFAYYPENS